MLESLVVCRKQYVVFAIFLIWSKYSSGQGCGLLTIPLVYYYVPVKSPFLYIYLLMYIFPGCWDPKVISSNDLFKATILTLQLGVLEPRTQILGGIALFDLEDIGTQHAWQVTPSMANRIVKLLVVSDGRFSTATGGFETIRRKLDDDFGEQREA